MPAVGSCRGTDCEEYRSENGGFFRLLINVFSGELFQDVDDLFGGAFEVAIDVTVGET